MTRNLHYPIHHALSHHAALEIYHCHEHCAEAGSDRTIDAFSLDLHTQALSGQRAERKVVLCGYNVINDNVLA